MGYVCSYFNMFHVERFKLNTMPTNQFETPTIPVQSSVYPSEPLPFRQWLDYIANLIHTQSRQN